MKFLLCFLLAMATAVNVFSAEPLKNLGPTVLLSTPTETAGGSGVVVRSSRVGNKYYNAVVTAAHIVRPDLVLRVPKFANGTHLDGYETFKPMLYAKDDGYDLAVYLFVSERRIPTAALDFDQDRLQIDTPVIRIGYGCLDDVRMDHGIVTSPRVIRPKSFAGLIRTNCTAVFGDSGGPLFTDRGVVGICHAIRTFNSHVFPTVSYFVPARHLLVWDDYQNNALTFVYNKSWQMPLMPLLVRKLNNLEVE